MYDLHVSMHTRAHASGNYALVKIAAVKSTEIQTARANGRRFDKRTPKNCLFLSSASGQTYASQVRQALGSSSSEVERGATIFKSF